MKVFKKSCRKKLDKVNMKTMVVALLLLNLCSCACLINGTKQPVQINSNPAGADITINSVHHGKTPNSVVLDRSGTYQVRLTKEGYLATDNTIIHNISGWFWLDLLCYVVPGIVDLGVGSAYNLEPESINVQLAASGYTETDSTQKLLDAKKLLEAGIITKEEFEAIKTKTLPAILQNTEETKDEQQANKPSEATSQ